MLGKVIDITDKLLEKLLDDIDDDLRMIYSDEELEFLDYEDSEIFIDIILEDEEE